MGKINYEEYIEILESNGYKVLGVSEIDDKCLNIEDSKGYRYKKRIYDIKKGKLKSSKIDYRNPFALYNLQLDVSKMNPNITLNYFVDYVHIHATCSKHGDFVMAKSNQDGRKTKYFCTECAREMNGLKRRATDEEIKERCAELDCEFIESFINEKRGQVSVKFICNKHRDKGIQVKAWYKMKTCSKSCVYCANNYNHTTEEFIKDMKEIDETIEILGEYVTCKVPILCRCKLCGEKWYTKPGALKSGNGCPNCNKSRGEKRIYNFLNKNNIVFDDQKKFDGLNGLGGRPLSYDFYIKEYNLLIEFQGIQHYKPSRFLGQTDEEALAAFKKQQEHDKRKKKYAKDNGYKLLEIKYDEYDNIEEILEKELHIKNIA